MTIETCVLLLREIEAKTFFGDLEINSQNEHAYEKTTESGSGGVIEQSERND
jgi:hypothetical protein